MTHYVLRGYFNPVSTKSLPQLTKLPARSSTEQHPALLSLLPASSQPREDKLPTLNESEALFILPLNIRRVNKMAERSTLQMLLIFWLGLIRI